MVRLQVCWDDVSPSLLRPFDYHEHSDDSARQENRSVVRVELVEQRKIIFRYGNGVMKVRDSLIVSGGKTAAA